MIWPADGQQKDVKKRQDGRKTSQEGKDRAKINSRPQRGCGIVCLLFWGDPVWYRMIYRDISWYHTWFPISCDITRSYDISRYRIHIPNFEDWYRDIVYRRNVYRYGTLVSTTQAGKRIMRTDEGTHKKWKPNTEHRPTTMASNTVLSCPKITSKRVPEGTCEESIGMRVGEI